MIVWYITQEIIRYNVKSKESEVQCKLWTYYHDVENRKNQSLKLIAIISIELIQYIHRHVIM